MVKFYDDFKKLWGYPKTQKNNSTNVLTLINTFRTVIEQLSLAFESLSKAVMLVLVTKV